MYIKQVAFQNFRNLSNLELTFNPGFVILSGPNGSGKTNFLEALYFGLALRRFPTSALDQLINNKQIFFRLRLTMSDGRVVEVFLERTEGRSKQQLKINGQAVSRDQFARQQAMISFLPEDLNLLTHSPAGRRRFLDETLSAVSAEYRHAMQQYNQALKQRNLALAQNTAVEIWDEQLADFGSVITKYRQEFVDFGNIHLREILTTLSPQILNVQIVYHAGGNTEKSEFVRRLEITRPHDMERLTTSIGPHRDDFEVLMAGDQPIVGYFSRGQLRAITLGLKILEKEYLVKSGHTPIMLLDDVFSEFDSIHQQQLLEFLKSFEQVFFTTAHLEEIKDFLPHNSQIFNIDAGAISPPARGGDGEGVGDVQ